MVQQLAGDAVAGMWELVIYIRGGRRRPSSTIEAVGVAGVLLKDGLSVLLVLEV
jgi:hypothetical protein